MLDSRRRQALDHAFEQSTTGPHAPMLSQEHTATRQLLADLPPEQRRALVHLLTCGSCQRLAANRMVVDALAIGWAGGGRGTEGRSTPEPALTPLPPAGTLRIPLLTPAAAPAAAHAVERTLAGPPPAVPGTPAAAETRPGAPARDPIAVPGEPAAAETRSGAPARDPIEKHGEALEARDLVAQLLRLPPADRRRAAAAKAAGADPQVVWLLIH